MKLSKVIFSVATFALAVASAASGYSVKVYDSIWIGTTQIKAGDYTIQMEGDKAIFKSGKNVVEVPATFSAGEHKFAYTALVTVDSKLHEIDLGGTKDKILFAFEAAK